MTEQVTELTVTNEKSESTEITKTEAESIPTELTVTDLAQLSTQQQLSIPWFDKKIAEAEEDVTELTEAYNKAKRNKWASTTLRNQMKKAISSRTYYQKVRAAILAGYHIIPNFGSDDIQLFAVRKAKEGIRRAEVLWWHHLPDAQDDGLDLGEGEYFGARPFDTTITRKVGGNEETHKVSIGYLKPIAFPAVMAKPVIMDATSQAFDEKIFDAIGVSPPTRPGRRPKRSSHRAYDPDPMIIGFIYDKKNKKRLSFMLAWHLDVASI